MSNPTMVLPGHHFLAANPDGLVLRGPEFRGTEDGTFQININTSDNPIWCHCGEPVGIPSDIKLNYSVLDGNGARAK